MAVNFGGNGSSNQAARADHSHSGYVARKQVDDNPEETYIVSHGRYHMSIGYSYFKSTKQIPHDVITDYCADEDGCEVILSMRDWTDETNEGTVASFDFHFFYDEATLRWRVTNGRAAGGNQGRDNSGVTQHAAIAFDACHFTDSVYIGGSNQNDIEKGMHLLYWTAYTNNQKKRCEITLED